MKANVIATHDLKQGRTWSPLSPVYVSWCNVCSYFAMKLWPCSPLLHTEVAPTHTQSFAGQQTKTIHHLEHQYNTQYSRTLSNATVTVTILTSYPTSASPLKSWESDQFVKSTHSCIVGVCWKRYSFVVLWTCMLLKLLKRKTATKECCAAHTNVVLLLHFPHKRWFKLFKLLIVI